MDKHTYLIDASPDPQIQDEYPNDKSTRPVPYALAPTPAAESPFRSEVGGGVHWLCNRTIWVSIPFIYSQDSFTEYLVTVTNLIPKVVKDAET